MSDQISYDVTYQDINQQLTVQPTSIVSSTLATGGYGQVRNFLQKEQHESGADPPCYEFSRRLFVVRKLS
jgi:hypothetical protein